MTDRNAQFQKMAADLGRQQAEFEKLAILSGLLKGYKALRGAATGFAGKAGKKFLSGVKNPTAKKWLGAAGAGGAKDMWTFGALGGGLGALGNPEDRLGGFFRGAAGGALSGLGWRAGSNLATGFMRKGLKQTGWGRKLLRQTAGKHQQKLFRPLTGKEQLLKSQGGKVPGMWARRNFGAGRQLTGGQAAKLMGARAALGALPIAGGLAVSSYTPTFDEGSAQVPAPMRVPPQAYYNAMNRSPGYY
jgi:hypothetical protein